MSVTNNTCIIEVKNLVNSVGGRESLCRALWSGEFCVHIGLNCGPDYIERILVDTYISSITVIRFT